VAWLLVLCASFLVSLCLVSGASSWCCRLSFCTAAGPLCDNCLKFGPAAGSVQVALERKWLDWLSFSVSLCLVSGATDRRPRGRRPYLGLGSQVPWRGNTMLGGLNKFSATNDPLIIR
jgi:hypothetical protein